MSVETHPRMSVLTGVLYAGLVAYLAGWYLDKWTGNFSLLLFLMSVVTAFYWVAERFHFMPARRAAAAQLAQQDQARRAKLEAEGIKLDHQDVQAAQQSLLRQPWW